MSATGLEIECKRCGRKHYPRTLARSLVCCSTPSGVTRLITEFHDPETGRRWSTVMSKTIVRFIQRPGRISNTEISP